jgi:uncharacterized membrane protein
VSIGPVQLLVLGFEGDNFTGEIAAELKRLREEDIVRLIDLMFVKKDDAGELDIIQASDLDEDEAMEFGAVVGALVGFGAAGEEGAEVGAMAGVEDLADGHAFDEEDVWYLADAIPPGTAAAIALIEHRWAIPFRDAIGRAGGFVLADEWVHAKDLLAVGVAAAEVADSQ